MYYCVVHYPQIDSTKIEALRQKYDPTAHHINVHITLVFPIKDGLIRIENIENHTRAVAEKQSAFDIKLAGFEKSWDNWLFLGLERGKEKVTALHDELYSDIMEPFLRKDLPFSPHISLGLFNQDGSSYSLKDPKSVVLNNESYERALKEAKEADLNYETTIKKLTLVTLNDNLTEILEFKDFPFKL